MPIIPLGHHTCTHKHRHTADTLELTLTCTNTQHTHMKTCICLDPPHRHVYKYVPTHIFTRPHTYVCTLTGTHTHKYSHVNTQTHRAFYYGVCARPKDPGRGNGKNQGENYMRQCLAPNKKAMECFPSSPGYFSQVHSDPDPARRATQLSLAQRNSRWPRPQGEPAAALPGLPAT